MNYKIEQGSERIHSVGGLSLVGLLLEKSGLREGLESAKVGATKVLERTADVFSSVVGLLSQGRTDYEDIELFPEDELFKDALDLG